MRILAVADFHRSQELREAVVEEANTGGYDLFLALGDYETPEYYEEMVAGLDGVQLLGLTGNWDFGFNPPENGAYTRLFNFKKVEFQKYSIVLLGAIYPDDYMQQIHDFFDDVPQENRIIASHYPPHMLGDLARTGTRAGFPEFRELIMREKPALWCCGHIHEDFGKFSLLKTTVLNCAAAETGKGWSIDMDGDGLDADEVTFLD